MAEVIALGASIIAIVQIADRVIGLCRLYLETVHNCPSDLRVMLIETSTMKAVLENVGFLVSCSNEQSTMLDGLSGAHGPLHGCRSTIEKMEALFPAIPGQSFASRRTKRQKIEASLASLAWPFKAEKAKRLVEELGRFKGTISLALTAESCHDIKHIKSQNENIFAMLSDQQRDRVYQWLQITDPTPLHHRACKQYEPETGDWMLRSTEWTNWLDGKSRCLKIEQFCIPTENYASVYYYCYFGHNQEEASPFLRWTINQLCRKTGLVPARLNSLFERGGQPSISELLGILHTILQGFHRVYITIDAIDESNPRDDLLAVLRDLATYPRFSKIQVLATSRQYIDIENVIKPISASVSMMNPLLIADIRLYVRSKINSNPRLKHWSQSLLEEVVEVLTTKANGMFRWVVCQIHTLERLKPEISIVKKALANLPKTIFETYERFFLAIPDDYRDIVQYALKWIYFNQSIHEESISVEILLQAVERSICEKTPDGHEYLVDERLIRELCGCMITIGYELRSLFYVQQKNCKGVLSVRLAHYTVWEFLTSGTLLNSPAGFFGVKEVETKLELAGTMIREALRADLSDYPSKDEEQGVNHDCDRHWEKKLLLTAIECQFSTYCALRSISCLDKLGREISQDEGLTMLVFNLLNPTNARFQSLQHLANICACFRNYFSCAQLARLEWAESTKGTNAAQLATLLFVDKSTQLADRFLGEKDRREVFQTLLEVPNLMLKFTGEAYKFRGSIMQLFAQVNEEFPYQFKYLLEIGDGLYDPSEVFLFFIGCHYDEESGVSECDRSDCHLQRLLEGANPNGPGGVATPLQIAVQKFDFDRVGLLLEAGADPNNTGAISGVPWEENTYLARFNDLSGSTPLKICDQQTQEITTTNVEDYESEKKRSMETMSKIRAMLLRYGARLC